MTQAPEHACALLVDGHDRLVLQLRPATARFAADRLGCFGGKCEPGEDARTALARELHEELGWSPPAAHPVVELVRGPRWIATFFAVSFPDVPVRLEPGFHLVRAPWRALPGLPVTSWHAAVIAAWRAGHARVEVP